MEDEAVTEGYMGNNAIIEGYDIEDEFDICNSSLLEVCYNQTSQCEQLLQQGPCPDNQWLVSLNGSATCASKPCPDNFYYSVMTKTCINEEELKCEATKEAAVSLEGHVGCECIDGKVEWSDGKCYSLYHQGPCKEGEYLIFFKNNTLKCVPNNCKQENWVEMSDNPGHCYELNSQGPCKTNETVQLNSGTMSPGCLPVLDRGIIRSSVVRCPKTEILDHTGKCKKGIRLATFLHFTWRNMPQAVYYEQSLYDQKCPKR